MCVLWRGVPATTPDAETAVLLATPVPASAEAGVAKSQARDRSGLSGEPTPGAGTLGGTPPGLLAPVAPEAPELHRAQSPAARRAQCPAA